MLVFINFELILFLVENDGSKIADFEIEVLEQVSKDVGSTKNASDSKGSLPKLRRITKARKGINAMFVKLVI
jgi:hypothetical protein